MKTTRVSTGALLLLTSLFAGVALADKEVNEACHGKAYKHMDSNKDGMVSKQEFMQFQERRFDKMKQKDGMVSLDQLDTDSQNRSMNHKEMGTTSNNPNVNARDAVNGNKY